MTTFARTFALATSLLCLAGCGGGPPNTSYAGTPPPHGGILSPLNNGEGSVEIVAGKGSGPEASFYLLKPDGSPFDPAPTSGTLLVGKTKIVLKVEGAGLSTPPGTAPFPGGDIGGDLAVEVGGKTMTIPLGVR